MSSPARATSAVVHHVDTHLVAAGDDLSGEPTGAADLTAEEEEGRFPAETVQGVEKDRRRGPVRSVVEGQGDVIRVTDA
jgi:hypothetical protein